MKLDFTSDCSLQFPRAPAANHKHLFPAYDSGNAGFIRYVLYFSAPWSAAQEDMPDPEPVFLGYGGTVRCWCRLGDQNSHVLHPGAPPWFPSSLAIHVLTLVKQRTNPPTTAPVSARAGSDVLQGGTVSFPVKGTSSTWSSTGGFGSLEAAGRSRGVHKEGRTARRHPPPGGALRRLAP